MSEQQVITASDVGTIEAAGIVKKKSKTPELDAVIAKLQEEKATIESKSAPLRTERKALAEKIAPDLDRMRVLDKEIHAAERPRLTEINTQLSKLKK